MLFEGREAKCAFVFNLLEAILYAVPQGSFARSSATKFHQDVSHALSKVFLYLALVLRYVFCSPALSWCMRFRRYALFVLNALFEQVQFGRSTTLASRDIPSIWVLRSS